MLCPSCTQIRSFWFESGCSAAWRQRWERWEKKPAADACGIRSIQTNYNYSVRVVLCHPLSLIALGLGRPFAQPPRRMWALCGGERGGPSSGGVQYSTKYFVHKYIYKYQNQNQN